jgi:hypothetical protein
MLNRFLCGISLLFSASESQWVLVAISHIYHSTMMKSELGISNHGKQNLNTWVSAHTTYITLLHCYMSHKICLRLYSTIVQFIIHIHSFHAKFHLLHLYPEI